MHFYLFHFFLQAQDDLIIDYELSIIQRQKDKTGVVDEFYKFLKEPKPYKLQITKGKSYYYKIDKILNNQGNKFQIIGNFSPNTFYDFTNNISKKEETIGNKTYIVSDSINVKYNYTLLRESSKYLGYNVKIATYKKDNWSIKVWYATDLPAKFGPEDYIGLPGLVLRVETFMNDSIEPNYIVKATNIEIVKNLELKPITKGIEISREKFKILNNELEAKQNLDNIGVETKID